MPCMNTLTCPGNHLARTDASRRVHWAGSRIREHSRNQNSRRQRRERDQALGDRSCTFREKFWFGLPLLHFPASERGQERRRCMSIPTLLASPPGGGEEHEWRAPAKCALPFISILKSVRSTIPTPAERPTPNRRHGAA